MKPISTQVTIDHQAARKILTSAILIAKKDDYTPKHEKTKEISDVILGQHLTYRYVLFTNLLAKSTNNAANGLAMQAGADIPGAFDSRSLCHKVVVDFDRDENQLSGKLGRSNEPYLNKPARYPALTKENAVRRGYDKSILWKCIDILGALKSQEDARAALEDAIYYTVQRKTSETNEITNTKLDSTELHKKVSEFAYMVISKSNEGESCAVITSLAFYIIGKGIGKNFEIKVHPVNQAGTSSNEILDIDIYLNKKIEYTIEVKDKIFSENDVDHAASKAKSGGINRLFFICGPKSNRALERNKIINKIAGKGISVSFLDIEQLIAMALGFAPNDLSINEVWNFINSSMTSARVKDLTRLHIVNCGINSGIIKSS